jgi:3'(2'), 5'-bisphosphate nucleotidase
MEITHDLIEHLLVAVRKASDEILKVYQTDFKVELKDDRSPVTKADKISGEILSRALEQTKVMIISEEESKPTLEARQQEKSIWLVDPLDGTKEFIRKNDEFCINLGLIENGEPVFGMIVSPTSRKVIYGGPSLGAFLIPLDENKWDHTKYSIQRLRDKKSKGLIFSRSHFTPGVSNLINRLEERYGTLSLIKKGSALKFFDLVQGKADFYPRMAPTMEWDIAAGDAIYRAVGGEVLDFTNFEPLQYNKIDLMNPNFIAKPKALNIF